MRRILVGIIVALALASMAGAQPNVSLGTMYGTKCNTDTVEVWQKVEQVVAISNPGYPITDLRLSFVAFNPIYGSAPNEILLPYEGVEFLNGFESMFDSPPTVTTETSGGSLIITIEASAGLSPGVPVDANPVEYILLKFNSELGAPPTYFAIDSTSSPALGEWQCSPYSEIIWGSAEYYTLWERPNCCYAALTNCFPFFQYTSSTFCEELTYDFDASAQWGDPYRFVMYSGPGSIDSLTGVWTYTPTAAETGTTIDITVNVVAAACVERRTGDLYWTPALVPCEMAFNVGPNSPPSYPVKQQYKFVATSDEILEVNMQIDDPDPCHDYIFSWFPHYQNPDIPGSVDPETGTFYYDGTPDDTGICYAYVVVDEGGMMDTTGFFIYHFDNAVCGDINHTEGTNVSDITWLIGYLFGADASPVPMISGDVNCSNTVNIADITYLIAYLFGNSNKPPCMNCPERL